MTTYRGSSEDVPVIDFMADSEPFIERVLNYGLSGLSVLPAALKSGELTLDPDERDATFRMVEILGDRFTIQCDSAISIADRIPIVSTPGTELYRARAHQFLMTAANETLRDSWEQMRLPAAQYLQVSRTLQGLLGPFSQHGMLQPHWIMFHEVRGTLQQIPVPHGLFLRVFGQELFALDIRQAD